MIKNFYQWFETRSVSNFTSHLGQKVGLGEGKVDLCGTPGAHTEYKNRISDAVYMHLLVNFFCQMNV